MSIPERRALLRLRERHEHLVLAITIGERAPELDGGAGCRQGVHTDERLDDWIAGGSGIDEPQADAHREGDYDAP